MARIGDAFIPVFKGSRREGVTSYVLLNARDEIVNKIVLADGANWSPPDGHRIVAEAEWEKDHPGAEIIQPEVLEKPKTRQQAILELAVEKGLITEAEITAKIEADRL